MDWIAEDQIGSLGLLLGEAIERLVDSHDQEFDKHAAMMSVKTPTLTQGDDGVRFDFQVKGNRQRMQSVAITVQPLPDPDDPGAGAMQLRGECECGCAAFEQNLRCPHTLACAWWMQEQITRRRGNGQLIEFLAGLKADAVAAGKQFVDELLRRAASARPEQANDEPTQLQWRLRVNVASQATPLTITPFEQRGRKGGKGWTKGREVRSFDLLEQNLLTEPLDSQIASLTSIPTHGFREDQYGMFQALRLLAGHENVAWDDSEAPPVDVFSSQLSLTLQPVEVDRPTKSKKKSSGKAKSNGPQTREKKQSARSARSKSLAELTEYSEFAESTESGETATMTVERDDNHVADVLAAPPGETTAVQFRPRLTVEGIDIDVHKCEVLFGHTSPVEPVVVLADRENNRIVVCTMIDSAASGLVQFLLREDYRDTMLDEQSAAKLALSAGTIDSLIHVSLPPQLAGPIQPILSELILQMRPRPGAGLKVALRLMTLASAVHSCPDSNLISCPASARPGRCVCNATWRENWFRRST